MYKRIDDLNWMVQKKIDIWEFSGRLKPLLLDLIALFLKTANGLPGNQIKIADVIKNMEQKHDLNKYSDCLEALIIMIICYFYCRDSDHHTAKDDRVAYSFFRFIRKYVDQITNKSVFSEELPKIANRFLKNLERSENHRNIVEESQFSFFIDFFRYHYIPEHHLLMLLDHLKTCGCSDKKILSIILNKNNRKPLTISYPKTQKLPFIKNLTIEKMLIVDQIISSFYCLNYEQVKILTYAAAKKYNTQNIILSPHHFENTILCLLNTFDKKSNIRCRYLPDIISADKYYISGLMLDQKKFLDNIVRNNASKTHCKDVNNAKILQTSHSFYNPCNNNENKNDEDFNYDIKKIENNVLKFADNKGHFAIFQCFNQFIKDEDYDPEAIVDDINEGRNNSEIFSYIKKAYGNDIWGILSQCVANYKNYNTIVNHNAPYTHNNNENKNDEDFNYDINQIKADMKKLINKTREGVFQCFNKFIKDEDYDLEAIVDDINEGRDNSEIFSYIKKAYENDIWGILSQYVVAYKNYNAVVNYNKSYKSQCLKNQT